MAPRSGGSRRARSQATARVPSAPGRARAAAAAERATCCLPAGYAQRRRRKLDPDRSRGGSVVLMDQPAEHIAAADLCGRRSARLVRLPGGSGERQRAVRALRVVVGQIAVKELFQMRAAEY